MAQSSSDETCLEIPGYKFWIEIDGKRAKQYQIERNNDVVSCYVASEVDKEFTIVTQKRQCTAMDIHYYLHDDCIKRCFFKPKQEGDYKLSHTRTEDGRRRFCFSSIDFADDEQMGLSVIPKNLGTIRLLLFPVKKFVKLGRGVPNTFDLKVVSAMSEKTKSIGFHSLSLRPPESKHTKKLTHGYKTVHVNPSKPLWYTIKFIYRPLDVLQAQGIAPRSNPQFNDRQVDQSPERLSLSPKPKSTEERKPPIKSNKKTYRTEKLEVVRTIETIIIEDSDSEDDGWSKVKTEEDTGSKRPRKSSIEFIPKKRQKLVLKPDPDTIILDSD